MSFVLEFIRNIRFHLKTKVMSSTCSVLFVYLIQGKKINTTKNIFRGFELMWRSQPDEFLDGFYLLRNVKSLRYSRC